MPHDPLELKLQHLPARPGVYLFKDATGEPIYIGKANSLRARVRSHFAIDASTSLKNREMLRRVVDIDTIVVGSEAEALLLEANLIKEHKPRFNIQLRDDKKYPYIKVTLQEPFPRVYVTRRLDNDGARYFGPYTDVGLMRQALELVKRLFTVRSCRYDLPTDAPERPCLDYHIGRCQAPCVGLQTRESYRAMIDDIMEVLAGKTDAVRRRIERSMRDAADSLDFERAATLRDTLTGLESIERRQRMLDVRGRDVDVLGTARDGDRGCAVLLRIRNGKLLGREVDFFENVGEEQEGELLSAAAIRMYLGRGDMGLRDLPRDILFPADFEDRLTVEGLLTGHAKRRVTTFVPVKGEKQRLLQLASQNARHLLEERSVLRDRVGSRADDTLYELQEALSMKVVPRVIVCFDISHTQGSEVVGSGVVFQNGEPHKAEYRRFRIRGEWGNDDFLSMAEIVERYFKKRIEDGLPLPDLALIDGGKGQLGAAVAAAGKAGANDVTFASLAKREEEIYLVGRPDPVRLPRTDDALRLLQRIRNEAHRFAITYNRKLRGKRTLSSELSDIPGIGPARQRALLEHFGSVRALKSATAQQIAQVPGFSDMLGGKILDHFARIR
ncbi:MAG: excinuclease ABC subunit UvrC [Longimicrobiales bacterium]